MKNRRNPFHGRLSVAIAVTLLLSASSASQDLRSYGFHAGFSSAHQEWSYTGPLSGLKAFAKERNGITAGLFTEWLHLPVFSLVTGAEYVQKGSSDEFIVTSAESPEGIGTIRMYNRTDYLSVPVLLKLRFDHRLGSLYALAGPAFHALLTNESDAAGEVTSKFTAGDYSMTYGAGFDLSEVTLYRIGLELRYNVPLYEIYHSGTLTVTNRSYDIRFVVTL